jgi:hypothetical protein
MHDYETDDADQMKRADRVDLASWGRRSTRHRRALMPNSGLCALVWLCTDLDVADGGSDGQSSVPHRKFNWLILLVCAVASDFGEVIGKQTKPSGCQARHASFIVRTGSVPSCRFWVAAILPVRTATVRISPSVNHDSDDDYACVLVPGTLSS